MQKLPMQTKNMADENFRKLAELFPNVVTETIVGYDEGGALIVERAIDTDMLAQEINSQAVKGADERYQFTWPDKRRAVMEANRPIYKTLRPCKDESLDFDNTENLYVEGDNLDVLKLLQETYLGAVKMIYIDPPYNTGGDFVYRDNFTMDRDEWRDTSGDYDDDGNRLFKNTDSNGRFHTDWLNMIYPRLKIARNLLTDDGVIFINIDDNEAENLKKICAEIFGSDNFIAQIVWQRRTSPDARRIISAGHEYILVFAKNLISNNPIKQIPLSEKDKEAYKNPDNDPRGPWISTDCTAQAGHGTKNQFYIFTTPVGRVVELPDSLCWRYTKEKLEEEVRAGRIWFGKDGTGVPRKKTYLSERSGRNFWTWWPNTEVGHTQLATQELTKLFGGKIFDFPKPLSLIQRCLEISTANDDIILDFFSGSGTTAHAVMQLNAEDGGNRKYIMVQLPEKTDEKSEAFKAGYATICDIGKERIRRAGAKIKDAVEKENKQLLLDGQPKKIPDIGFRVLKVDSSHFLDEKIERPPAQTTAETLWASVGNIKPDRTDEDLLFYAMLQLGIPLSSSIKETSLQGKRVFLLYQGELLYLAASFAPDLTEEIIIEIARLKPFYFTMRDASQSSDSLATNFEEIFKHYSPTTERWVL